MKPSCSLGEQAAALKGAMDAQQGTKADMKSKSPSEQEHYVNGFNRVAMNIDKALLDASKSPLYIPHEFMAPSDMFGGDITHKVDEIYNVQGSTRDKQMAIKNLGESQIDKLPNYLKAPFANYIQQRIDYLNASPQSTSPLMATVNKMYSSIFESWMKNNVTTSFLHITTGTMRLIASDMDSLGTNAFQGILRAGQDTKSFTKLDGNGILAKSDYLIHKMAEHTASFKYEDPVQRENLISKATYRYTPGDTPGYFGLSKQMGPGSPFALARFAIRDFVDPVGQCLNISRYMMGDRSPRAAQNAAFAAKYLLGMGVAKSIVFGTGAALPSIVNLSLNGMFMAANAFTGSQYNIKDMYKQLDNILPTNELYKLTGIDMSEHFAKGIPFAAALSGLTNIATNTLRDGKHLAESWQSGDMAQVGKYAMKNAADILPIAWGLKGPLSIIKDTNTLRLMRSAGYAIGGDIDWKDVPKMWGLQTIGQGKNAVSTIQNGQETLQSGNQLPQMQGIIQTNSQLPIEAGGRG